MQVAVKEVSPIRRKITVSVPSDQAQAALDAAFTKLSKTAKIKGFRPGKVPMAMVKKMMRREAEAEAMEQLMQDTYPAALDEVKVEPISRPNVDPGEFTAGSDFSYSAEFEVYPTVELKKYTGLKLECDKIEMPADAVDQQLEYMRQSMTQLEPAAADAVLAEGFVATVDFSGTADGKAFEGSEAKDFMLDIGAGSLLPEFEEQMMGAKAGEEREVRFSYPADYYNVNLAGSESIFMVSVKELKVKRMPELDDEFAKGAGEYQTLAELTADIKKRIEEGKKHEQQQQLREQLMQQLVDTHDIEVPESMISQEIQAMYSDYMQDLRSRGQNPEKDAMQPAEFLPKCMPIAQTRVKGTLVIDAISEKEGFTVSEDDLEERYAKMAEQSGDNVPKVKLYCEQNDLIPNLKTQILREKTLDFMIDSAKIKENKVKTDKK